MSKNLTKEADKKIKVSFKKRRFSLKNAVFSKRYLTKEGIFGLISGMLSFLLLLVLIVDTSLPIGELGCIGFILSFIGLVFSVKSLNVEKSDQRLGRTSAILNFITLLFYFSIYMYGFFVNF